MPTPASLSPLRPAPVTATRARRPSPVAKRRQNVVGFTVRSHGNITTMPTKFTVGSHEIAHWLIGNKSGQRITVSLVDFFRGSTPVEPLAWLVSETVEIEADKMGFIAALRNPDYENESSLGDDVKYTIRVVGPGFAMDHDPDGEIKP
jgi:hypothetical protein